MPKNIKILIAEDHNVVREGLRILISSDPALEIAGEAENGQQALNLAKQLKPDVILMDLSMPGGNGLEAARHIRREAPTAKVLVLSAYQDEETVQKAMAAGVNGYMTKHSAADDLLTAIREVNEGKAYYSPSIARRLRFRQRSSFQTGRSPAKSGKLTPRETEVLGLIAQGQPNKEIAFNLGLSIKTVEKHRQSAMDKLDLHDVASLTRYAFSKGLAQAPAAAPGALAAEPVLLLAN